MIALIYFRKFRKFIYDGNPPKRTSAEEIKIIMINEMISKERTLYGPLVHNETPVSQEPTMTTHCEHYKLLNMKTKC